MYIGTLQLIENSRVIGHVTACGGDPHRVLKHLRQKLPLVFTADDVADLQPFLDQYSPHSEQIETDLGEISGARVSLLLEPLEVPP